MITFQDNSKASLNFCDNFMKFKNFPEKNYFQERGGVRLKETLLSQYSFHDNLVKDRP